MAKATAPTMTGLDDRLLLTSLLTCDPTPAQHEAPRSGERGAGKPYLLYGASAGSSNGSRAPAGRSSIGESFGA
jgi:hypothetical protein